MTFKALQFFLLALLASSCTFIVFDEPMPPDETALDRFPESLQGHYTNEMQQMIMEVEFGENYINSNNRLSYLSDSVVLKPFGKKYILNTKIIDPKLEADGKWSSYILSPGKEGIINVEAFCVVDTTYTEKLITKYGGKPMKGPQEMGGSLVFLNPDLKQFETLTKDKKARIPLVLKPVK